MTRAIGQELLDSSDDLVHVGITPWIHVTGSAEGPCMIRSAEGIALRLAQPRRFDVPSPAGSADGRRVGRCRFPPHSLLLSGAVTHRTGVNSVTDVTVNT
jgi:hypothetical protein